MLRHLTIACGLALAAALNACSDPENATKQAPKVAIVNAALAPMRTFDVLSNGNLMVPGLPYLQPTTLAGSPYLTPTRPDEGTPWQLQVRRTGQGADISSTQPGWQPGQRYTVFLYDSSAQVRALNLSDETGLPATGMAKVRFIHLLLGYAGPVDFVLDSTVVASNVAFGTATDFTLQQAGSYKLRIRQAGTYLAAVPAIYDVALASGRVFSQVLAGQTGLVFGQTAPTSLLLRHY